MTGERVGAEKWWDMWAIAMMMVVAATTTSDSEKEGNRTICRVNVMTTVIKNADEEEKEETKRKRKIVKGDRKCESGPWRCIKVIQPSGDTGRSREEKRSQFEVG